MSPLRSSAKPDPVEVPCSGSPKIVVGELVTFAWTYATPGRTRW
jgi:hypothetical protein